MSTLLRTLQAASAIRRPDGKPLTTTTKTVAAYLVATANDPFSPTKRAYATIADNIGGKGPGKGYDTEATTGFKTLVIACRQLVGEELIDGKPVSTFPALFERFQFNEQTGLHEPSINNPYRFRVLEAQLAAECPVAWAQGEAAARRVATYPAGYAGTMCGYWFSLIPVVSEFAEITGSATTLAKHMGLVQQRRVPAILQSLADGGLIEFEEVPPARGRRGVAFRVRLLMPAVRRAPEQERKTQAAANADVAVERKAVDMVLRKQAATDWKLVWHQDLASRVMERMEERLDASHFGDLNTDEGKDARLRFRYANVVRPLLAWQERHEAAAVQATLEAVVGLGFVPTDCLHCGLGADILVREAKRVMGTQAKDEVGTFAHELTEADPATWVARCNEELGEVIAKLAKDSERKANLPGALRQLDKLISKYRKTPLTECFGGDERKLAAHMVEAVHQLTDDVVGVRPDDWGLNVIPGWNFESYLDCDGELSLVI